MGTRIYNKFVPFINLNNTNKIVISSVKEAADHLIGNSEKLQNEIPTSSKVFIEQIITSGKNSLESNTISFLFQIFSITLISIGVYLLSEAKKKMSIVNQQYDELIKKISDVDRQYDDMIIINKNLTHKQKYLSPFLNCISEGNKIERYLSFAHQNIVQLDVNRLNESKNYLVQTRDWLKYAIKKLEKISNDNYIGIEPEQIGYMKDWIDAIDHVLSGNKDEQDLKALCEDYIDPIKTLLDDEKFIQKYKNIAKELKGEELTTLGSTK